MTLYYIASGGGKDGPHDIIAIMRRVRAKKILPDTLIYSESAATPSPASSIAEIAPFFAQSESDHAPQHAPTLAALFGEGWRFILEYNAMTVYAGGLLLVSLLLAVGLVSAFGPVIGGLAGWLLFLVLHHIYLVFALRLYRGQTLSPYFITHQFSPVLPMLAMASVALALMMVGGLLLLIIPGIWVAITYAFVPFLIFDRRAGLADAMHASRLLQKKYGNAYAGKIALIVALHVLCALLIIPIPLTLLLFAAALARLYEDISAL